MEIICRVIWQSDLKVRPYEDKVTHEQRQFKTVAVRLQCGADTIHAEAVQDQAEYLQQYPLSAGVYYVAYLSVTARSFIDAQGAERWQTEFRLQRILTL